MVLVNALGLPLTDHFPLWVEYLTRQAEELGFIRQNCRYWSIAELKISDAAYAALDTMVLSLGVGIVRGCIKSFDSLVVRNSPLIIANYPVEGASAVVSRSAALGFVLLVWLVEKLRREQQNHSVWTLLSPNLFRDRCAGETLFRDEGIPSEDLRDCLVRAARFFRLRHIFDAEYRRSSAPNARQRWYDSLLLQAGLCRAFRPQLGRYLDTGIMPWPLQQLVSGADPDLRSESLSEVWGAMGRFRRRLITEPALRALLNGSPWVGSSWVDEWVDELRSSVRHESQFLSVARRGDASSVSDTSANQPIPSDVQPIVSKVELRWPSSENKAIFVLTLSSPFPLTTSSYVRVCVVVNEKARKILVRKGNGQLEPVGDNTFEWAPDSAYTLSVLSVSVVASDGKTLLTQDIQLWDESADVQCFDSNTGERIIGTNKQSNDYFLLLAPHLRLEPEGQPEVLVANRRLVRVRMGDVLVYDGDSVIWGHLEKPVSVRATDLAVQLVTPATASNPTATVKVQSGGLNIESISSPRQGFDLRGASWPEAIRFAVAAADLHPSLTLRFRVRQGNSLVTVRKDVPVYRGVVHYPYSSQPCFLGQDTVLNVYTAERSKYRLLASGSPQADVAVLAARQVVVRRSSEAKELRGLHGFGEPLDLGIGNPFRKNAQLERIVCSTVSMGRIKEVRFDRNIVHLITQTPYELDPSKTRFIAWYQDNTLAECTAIAQSGPYTQESEPFGSDTFELQEVKCDVHGPLRALLWLHGDNRQGAWWADDWYRGWPTGREAINTVLWVIRAFQLPFLDPGAHQELVGLWNEYPEAICEQWLVDSMQTPSSLSQSLVVAKQPSFNVVVRVFFDACNLNVTNCDQIRRILSRQNTPGFPALQGAFLALAELSPRKLREWIALVYGDLKEQERIARQCALLSVNLMNHKDNLKKPVLRQLLSQLRFEARRALCINDTELSDLLDDDSAEATERALSVTEFRALATFVWLSRAFVPQLCVH